MTMLTAALILLLLFALRFLLPFGFVLLFGALVIGSPNLIRFDQAHCSVFLAVTPPPEPVYQVKPPLSAIFLHLLKLKMNSPSQAKTPSWQWGQRWPGMGCGCRHTGSPSLRHQKRPFSSFLPIKSSVLAIFMFH